jgi:hypothetical protein
MSKLQVRRPRLTLQDVIMITTRYTVPQRPLGAVSRQIVRVHNVFAKTLRGSLPEIGLREGPHFLEFLFRND